MSTLNVTAGGSYSVSESNSTITIDTSEPVTLQGSGAALNEVQIVVASDSADLTAQNLNITNNANGIIQFGSGTENFLTVAGTNTFEVSTGGKAAVNVGGGLKVEGTGSLKATTLSGACIGINVGEQKSAADVEISGGTFDLTARSGACAVGGAGAVGNAIGNITINGTANITAKTPNGYGSAIGACYWGKVGNIIITDDSIVNATTGQHAAAVGGGAYTTVGNITINGNATVNAVNNSELDDSAAIGSGLGAQVQSLGNIVIGGNANVTVTSNLGLAIDNIEWYREIQELGAPATNDHALINDDTITIGENATFIGYDGDIYSSTTINGTELNAAVITYDSTDGLLFTGGGVIDDSELNKTLLNITAGGSYNIAEGSVGKIFINTTEPVTLNGGDYVLNGIQILTLSNSADLTIDNLSINNKDTSIIQLGNGADNKLTVNGTNDFSITKGGNAGINVGGGVEIDGSGSLKIITMNGAAIGTDLAEDLSTSNIKISGGTFDLKNRSGGCAVGGCGNGSKIGDITITGTASVKAATPQGYAAAIGSAYRGTVGDILIDGDATVEATSGQHAAAIGSAVFCDNGNITIGGRASVIANTTSTDYKDAGIGGTYGDQVKSLGDIKIIEDATVIASSAHGLALDNRLYVETTPASSNYWTDNTEGIISISGDTSTANQSTVILSNGNTSDVVSIGGGAYQGDKFTFYDGIAGQWATIGGGFVYSGHATNNPGVTADVTLIGSELKDTGGDGTPDNVRVDSFSYSSVTGVMAIMSGLDGEVTINNSAVGVIGDDDYEVHFTAKVIDNASNAIIAYTKSKEIRGISDGATVNANTNDIVGFDANAKVYIGDVEKIFLYNKNHKSGGNPHAQIGIDNNDAGANLTVEDDLLTEIGGLKDGYSVSVTASDNVSNELTFHTDGGNGNINLNGKVYNLIGDDDFTFVFDENSSVIGMKNFDGMLQTDDTSLIKGEWITLSGGKFQYNGNALNNPAKFSSFVVSGESITDTDNLSVKRIVYVPAQKAYRFELNGIDGRATVEDVDLGISGDSLYSAHFTKINDQVQENIVLMNISDGATVENNFTAGTDNDALIKFSDGEHSILTSDTPQGKVTSINADNDGNGFFLNVSDGIFCTIGGFFDGYAVTINSGDNIGDELTFKTDGGNGSIAIADETLSVGDENDFTVEFDDEGKIIFGRWTTIDGGFVYSGHASNNFAKTADVSLIGSELKDNDGDGTPDNINISLVSSDIMGVLAIAAGLGGEVTINNKAVGVSGDDDYEVHFTAKVIDNASDAIIAYTETKEIRGISDGATVNANINDIVGFDANAKAHIGDVEKIYLYNKNHKSDDSPHAQIGIDNNDAGAILTVKDDLLTEIGGLKDGYSVSVTASDNVSDELTFNTDGGFGIINLNDAVYSLTGDKNFAFELNSDGSVKSLKNFSGKILPTAETIAPNRSRSKKTFTYTRSDTTADYTPADNEITYDEEISAEQFTLSSSENTKVLTGGSVSEKIIPEENSLLICDNVRSPIDMTNADHVTVVARAGTVTLDNYDAATGSAVLIPNADNIFDALEEDSIRLVGNEIKFDSSAGVEFNNPADSIIVNLTTADGLSEKVGFTTRAGIILDTTEEHGNFILKGNKRSTITAGNGNDTILAAAKNSVDAGDGRNQIYLAQEGNSTVVMSGNGLNTVHGFNAGFDIGSDVIHVRDFNNLMFKFNNSGLMLSSDDTRLKLTATDGEKILLTDDTKTIRTVVAQNNQTINVDEPADAFFGKRSGLNFSDYKGNVEINLADGTGKIDNNEVTINGFNKLQGGDGHTALIGDSAGNTLIAGNGYSSIWSGAGNDKLVGKGDSSDKVGRTTFFFDGGGHDVISNFTFLSPENRFDDIDDIINVGDNNINNAYRAGNDVVVTFDQYSYLILEDAVGKDFRIADMIAKVDRNIAYDGLADCYVASGGSSLTVNSTVDSAEIWLDNSHGTLFFGNIRTLDASAVEGNTSLVGNEFDNTVIAGPGDSSLWGGYYSTNDLLIGGAGQNTFFYCVGNGNDTIQGVNDGDAIILDEISLDQIISANITADAVSIDFFDGGSLQINGSADVTFQLADGSKFSANHETLNRDSK